MAPEPCQDRPNREEENGQHDADGAAANDAAGEVLEKNAEAA